MTHITPDNARTLAGEASAALASQDDPILPLTVCGPEVSYFTGKLESVLRFMELPHRRVGMSPPQLLASTGVAQVPGLQLADGRWQTDTTPIIAWLDERYPEHQVIPRDPTVAFFSRLLEDFADEWLWRPAMHYRWDYEEAAQHLSRVLSDEVGRGLPVPGFVKRKLIRNRQRGLFTRGDGVSPETWEHVEKIYLDSLLQIGAIVETRPFLLGDRPSLADFGFFGPMFRHFAMDPPSARIMRETAPGVFEWVARVWNARSSRSSGELLNDVPDDWGPILDKVGAEYLPSLCANAEAFERGASHHDLAVGGVVYRKLRTSRYRVWCLEELRRRFEALLDSEKNQARARLEAHGCWEPLWRVKGLNSGVDPKGEAPFAGSSASATEVDSGEAKRLHWVPVHRPQNRP